MLAARWNFAKLHRDYRSNPSASPTSPSSLSLPLSSSLSIRPSLSVPLPISRPCLSVSVDNLLAARWNFAKLHRNYPSNPSASSPSPLYPLSPLSLSLSLPLSQSDPLSPSPLPLSCPCLSVSEDNLLAARWNFAKLHRDYRSNPSASPTSPSPLYPSLLLSIPLSLPLSQSLPPSPSLSLVRASVSQSTICLQQRGISPNITGTIPPIPLPPLPLPPLSLLLSLPL